VNIEETAAALWGDFLPQGQTTYCAYATQFKRWSDALCTTAAATAQAAGAEGAVAVNQAYVQLLTKYFDWRAAVPKSHRNRIGDLGHTCIFHVFAQAYQQLRTVELSLSPPLLFLPVAPAEPPQPVYKLTGIPLGDIEEEEE
jgi:hypothetical protein